MSFHTVASSSAEQSNPIGSVAAAISTDQVENEQITWNYNPHTITRSNSKTKQNDKDENLSYNCYSQTLNKLMGEFNVSKRKRNNNRNGDDINAAKLIDKKSLNKNKMPWSKNDERRDGDGDSYFWSKVLCNNNNSQQNDLLTSTSTLSSVNSTKKSTINTAVNSFNISNQPNNLDMNEVDAINCNINNDLNKFALTSQLALATTPSGSDLAKATSDVTSKILGPKNKNLHQDKPIFHNDKQFDDMAGNELNRMTVNNDLSAANNSFLQALNDLRLDYNELGAANGQSDRQRSSAPSQSKTRYTSSTFFSKIIEEENSNLFLLTLFFRANERPNSS